jgi:hypothetical protein
MVLRAGDVILDSASFIPGVGAMKEVKEGTLALLDDAQDVDDGLLRASDLANALEPRDEPNGGQKPVNA